MVEELGICSTAALRQKLPHIDEELAAPEGAKGKFAEKSMLDPCPVRLPIQKPSGPRGE